MANYKKAAALPPIARAALAVRAKAWYIRLTMKPKTYFCEYETTTCKACGEKIGLDNRFLWYGPGRTYHFWDECPARGASEEALSWQQLSDWEESLAALVC